MSVQQFGHKTGRRIQNTITYKTSVNYVLNSFAKYLVLCMLFGLYVGCQCTHAPHRIRTQCHHVYTMPYSTYRIYIYIECERLWGKHCHFYEQFEFNAEQRTTKFIENQCPGQIPKNASLIWEIHTIWKCLIYVVIFALLVSWNGKKKRVPNKRAGRGGRERDRMAVM